jgi:hypothetical protein
MPGDVNASDLRLRPPLARRKIDPRGPVSCCTFRLAIHPVDGLRAVQLGGSSSWVKPVGRATSPAERDFAAGSSCWSGAMVPGEGTPRGPGKVLFPQVGTV